MLDLRDFAENDDVDNRNIVARQILRTFKMLVHFLDNLPLQKLVIVQRPNADALLDMVTRGKNGFGVCAEVIFVDFHLVGAVNFDHFLLSCLAAHNLKRKRVCLSVL